MMSLTAYFADLDGTFASRLQEVPTAALDDLLFDRAFPRSSELDAAAHVDRLLSNLTEPELFDAALQGWIVDSWPPREGDDPAMTADAWIAAFRIVLHHQVLGRSYRTLLDRFPASEDALGWLSEGPTRDPLRWYLHAIARWQPDRRLVEHWWDLCELRRGKPWYLGEVGLLGLTHLPTPDRDDSGFSTEVVAGTVRYGLALARNVRDGAVGLADARRFFVSVARRMRRSFPIPELWAEAIAALGLDLQSFPEGWLEAALPEVQRAAGLPIPHGRVQLTSRARQDEWPTVASATAQALKQGPDPTIADEFLDEQRRHAQVSGEFDPLVRSLTFFANSVLQVRPKFAETWAREALAWDPYRDASWTAYVSSLLRQRDYGRASEESLRMYELVPWHVNSHHQLGLALEQAGQADLAEAVHRLGLHRFPNDPYPVAGLVHVLLSMDRDEESIELARAGLSNFPGNPILETLLAIALAGTSAAPSEEIRLLLDRAAARAKPSRLTHLALRRLHEGEPIRSLIAMQPSSWRPEGMGELRVKRLLRNASQFGLPQPEARTMAPPGNPQLAARLAAEDVLTRVVAEGAPPLAEVLEQAAAARRRYPGAVEVVFADVKARLVEARHGGLHLSEEHARSVSADVQYLKTLRTFSAVASRLIRSDYLASYRDGAALEQDLRTSLDQLREVTIETGSDRGVPEALAEVMLSDPPMDGRDWLASHRALVDDVEEAELFALR